MFASRHTLPCTATLLVCMAFLSGSLARALPKIKRDNSTCCSYRVTNQNNAYYRYEHIIDFSTMTSMDQFYQSGWEISNGWQAGAANPVTGQAPIASENNIQLVRGVGLTMTVPGGQSPSASTFSVAEITFPDIALGGIFQVEARITDVPGTVFGIFTMHGDQWDAPLGWQDEQDIEILSSSVMKPAPYHEAGIQLTNFDPDTGAMMETVHPFPVDPTQAFHKYAISWYPKPCASAVNYNPTRMTEYRFDDALLNAPTQYASTHPSRFIINLWTSADPYFSAGPPPSDAVVTIKKITAYYDKPNRVANGACVAPMGTCTPALACAVTL